MTLTLIDPPGAWYDDPFIGARQGARHSPTSMGKAIAAACESIASDSGIVIDVRRQPLDTMVKYLQFEATFDALTKLAADIETLTEPKQLELFDGSAWNSDDYPTTPYYRQPVDLDVDAD